MRSRRRKSRRPKYSAYKVSIAIVILLFILILAPRVYQVYELHEQITQAELRKEKEKQELDMKKKELNDSRVIEDKARHELGLVKPSEVPYVP